ncbi:hypothetical protein V6N13_136874 [Hibiscus sabdariffa]
MAPYEALYGRKCRTPICWTELYDRKILGPELIQETENTVRLIRDRLKQAFDRQKSYADRRRKDIEFAVGDQVFLKVSPWKKVLRFGRKGKLSPRFIGPYRILERVGTVAYRLELPPQLSRIHNIFHVSMLRQYRPDPSHIIQAQDVELRPDLSYDEEPVQILDQDERILRNRRIPMVKVQWINPRTVIPNPKIKSLFHRHCPSSVAVVGVPHRRHPCDRRHPPDRTPTSTRPIAPPLAAKIHPKFLRKPICFGLIRRPSDARSSSCGHQQFPRAKLDQTVPPASPFTAVSAFADIARSSRHWTAARGPHAPSKAIPGRRRLRPCRTDPEPGLNPVDRTRIRSTSVLVTLPAVLLPSPVPLDLYSPVIPSSHVPTLRPRVNPYGPKVTPWVAPTPTGPRVSPYGYSSGELYME